ncbi:MAG TPA: uroporphyrinogen decarboxylase family protein [bacterium]|uniref:Uroporphyrinogen decarboxylase (URO-D) n=1 Tax=candidate division TA06 bacterium ADurb.Bin417 TaxID=1852828 RepID=A0A1V5MKA8_UNCT6|nr:MAG: Uroporphyrinogen decarboxylase (URO-D) [candidate division TA06 bacterium ADurb.Bin417]HNQ34680.1 uroporphyrinogen decarboxylase family protein [bacterium]HNS48974.1 uroporphyrinogen decarboxylase family protein [bacterium]
MTAREINLAVFEGRPVDRIPFQPRLETWYEWNRAGKPYGAPFPEKYRGLSLRDIYDDLGAAPRYLYGFWPVEEVNDVEVRITVTENGDRRFRTIETPAGRLVSEYGRSSEGGWRLVRHPVSDADEIESAIAFFRHTSYHFRPETFEAGSAFFGDRAQPQFYLPRGGYQALSIVWMGLEGLIYNLADRPGRVEALMAAIDDSYDTLYRELAAYGRARLVNFGENIDANIVSPRHFETYCLPFYEKRAGQLRAAGIRTHIHLDGSLRPLLKYLKFLPFDGLEALTPRPQGDVELEELRAAAGGKVLLDGIPAISFLPSCPEAEFQATVERVVKLFAPRLVLGASDEVPPAGEIERVRWAADYCRRALKPAASGPEKK